MLDRPAIAARLQEIATLLDLHGGSRFKSRAFARASRTVEASRMDIAKLIHEGRLTDLPGIGEAISRQIMELRETDTSALLETLRAGLPRGVVELANVPGVGLQALKNLHEAGIGTIEELRAAAEAGELQKVAGFGAKREAKILAGVARYQSVGPAVLLSRGLALADAIASDLGEHEVTIAGDVRRGAEIATELALVTTAPSSTVMALPRAAAARRESSESSDSVHLRLPDGTRVRVVSALPGESATALLFATGSRDHIDALVAHAEKRGMRLSPRGLQASDGAPIPVHSETEVYHALGLGFVPPELREEGMPLPDRDIELVTAEDVAGFVHCHTTWSDGKGTIEEMARAAEARGASFITITDHSAAAHYANGLDVDRLRRQWDEIDEVQERVAVRILKGTEADILADGALDWPDVILETLDVVIASIHARHRQDETKMTDRLLRAMRHPIFKIWGHPLGRLVPSRPPIACRVEEVLDALAESQGAIEINGDPHRLDLEPRWIRAARERGLSFVLSVDAHSTRELDNLRYAAIIARRGGVRRSEVLNARAAAWPVSCS